MSGRIRWFIPLPGPVVWVPRERRRRLSTPAGRLPKDAKVALLVSPALALGPRRTWKALKLLWRVL